MKKMKMKMKKKKKKKMKKKKKRALLCAGQLCCQFVRSSVRLSAVLLGPSKFER